MIAVGVLALMYPIVGDVIANKERSFAVSEYANTMGKLSTDEISKQRKMAEEYNKYIFDKQQGKIFDTAIYKNIMNYGSVMGTIDIPAIDIKEMPFYHGTAYQTLNKGLGHFEESSIPIGGENTRSVITGHSGVKNQVLFTDIRSLKEGDIFYINILGERLAYEINSFEEILPSETDKVKVVEGTDQVTLLTCTPPGINTYRLLVTGNRIPYEKAIKQDVKKRNLWSYKNLVLISLGVSCSIFLILIGLYQYYVRKFRSKDKKVSLKAGKKLKKLFLFTKAIFIALFVFMIVILGLAIYGYIKIQQEVNIEETDIGNNNELYSYNLNKINDAKYEEKQIASINIADYAKSKINLQTTVNNWGIGKLVIPDVEIDLPILAGLNNQNLLTGVATYSASQQFGRGNFVLLSHNIFEKDVLLNRIKYLNKGQEIYTTDYKRIYKYEVSVNEIVNDTEVEYVDQDKNQDVAKLTLLRCEGDIGTTYRRVVQGELAGSKELSQLTNEQLKKMNLIKNNSDDKQIDKIIETDPIVNFDKVCLLLSSKILMDPLQTAVPIVIIFLIPILFFYTI